jgi:molybdopterin-biosynthesis enzyme MoeA-like protein
MSRSGALPVTGMPALGPTHDDETLWAVVAFVEQLPALTAEEYARLRKQEHDGHAHCKR